MARTVFSTTPPARPRHPACAAATVVPASSVSNTGTQSATRIAHTVPAFRATAASASDTATGTSASITRLPCTCFSHTGSPGRSARRALRFAATAAGSSAVRRPRLKLAYGPLLAPPVRVVTNARTLEDAGQSGTIQSGWGSFNGVIGD